MKDTSLFSTAELSLAAYLSSYFPIWAIERSDPNKVKFLFERSHNLDELVQLFWRKEAQIEPITYFSQIKLIKSRIYEHQ